MNVDKIGYIKAIYNAVEADSKQTSKISRVKKKDSIHISNEAKVRFNEDRLKEIVKNAPDIREDRVADAKEKMASQTYINDILYDKVLDAILNSPWSISLEGENSSSSA